MSYTGHYLIAVGYFYDIKTFWPVIIIKPGLSQAAHLSIFYGKTAVMQPPKGTCFVDITEDIGKYIERERPYYF